MIEASHKKSSFHCHLTPYAFRESGEMTYQFENNEAVVYNKENLLNPWFVVKVK